MKAIILIGVSASGKTTWAREYLQKHKNTININRDDVRFSITGAKNWSEYKFNKVTENMVTEINKVTIIESSKLEKDIIISDTNLNDVRRKELSIWLKSLGYAIELKYFHVTLDEAWKRDSMRQNPVGRDVIYRQWKQWLEIIKYDKYTQDDSLPSAVIFDLDGTLALMGDRTPYEWAKVGGDSVRQFIRTILIGYHDYKYKIIIVSGRDNICRSETAGWLYNNDIPYTELFMRPEGDLRKDSIVKKEIIFNDIKSRYNICGWVDDRPQVIRMLNDIGIPNVIAVADQNIEF